MNTKVGAGQAVALGSISLTLAVGTGGSNCLGRRKPMIGRGSIALNRLISGMI
jgi:hypothetical protein